MLLDYLNNKLENRFLKNISPSLDCSFCQAQNKSQWMQVSSIDIQNATFVFFRAKWSNYHHKNLQYLDGFDQSLENLKNNGEYAFFRRLMSPKWLGAFDTWDVRHKLSFVDALMNGYFDLPLINPFVKYRLPRTVRMLTDPNNVFEQK